MRPGSTMITVPELAADALGSFLSSDMQQRFGSSNARLTELVPYVARLALECIGNSDALYHNVEHTMLVTLAGRDILRGLAVLAPTKATDYAHLIVACLLHDIGYVRGILKDDHAEGYVVDAAGGRVKLPRGASDAALLTHHVDRSILFVLDRIEPIELLDAKRIARAVECTRFPVSIPPEHEEIEEEGALLRVRGGRPEPPARLRLARGPRRSLSAILLEQRFAADRDRHPLSQCDRERTAVDRQPLQQRVSGRARRQPVGAAPLTPDDKYREPNCPICGPSSVVRRLNS